MVTRNTSYVMHFFERVASANIHVPFIFQYRIELDLISPKDKQSSARGPIGILQAEAWALFLLSSCVISGRNYHSGFLQTGIFVPKWADTLNHKLVIHSAACYTSDSEDISPFSVPSILLASLEFPELQTPQPVFIPMNLL
jgi:hypothetical protein